MRPDLENESMAWTTTPIAGGVDGSLLGHGPVDGVEPFVGWEFKIALAYDKRSPWRIGQ